jgi:hypothetical protein
MRFASDQPVERIARAATEHEAKAHEIEQQRDFEASGRPE